MENIQMALNLIKQGNYMISIDPKDAYFNIPIFAPHHQYPSYIWKDQTRAYSYLTTVLKPRKPLVIECFAMQCQMYGTVFPFLLGTNINFECFKIC